MYDPHTKGSCSSVMTGVPNLIANHVTSPHDVTSRVPLKVTIAEARFRVSSSTTDVCVWRRFFICCETTPAVTASFSTIIERWWEQLALVCKLTIPAEVFWWLSTPHLTKQLSPRQTTQICCQLLMTMVYTTSMSKAHDRRHRNWCQRYSLAAHISGNH